MVVYINDLQIHTFYHSDYLIVYNFNHNHEFVENYCTQDGHEVTNPLSPYYVGMQDAFTYANNNIDSVNVGTGVNNMGYDDSLLSDQCKKLGFEHGISLYTSGRQGIQKLWIISST